MSCLGNTVFVFLNLDLSPHVTSTQRGVIYCHLCMVCSLIYLNEVHSHSLCSTIPILHPFFHRRNKFFFGELSTKHDHFNPITSEGAHTEKRHEGKRSLPPLYRASNPITHALNEFDSSLPNRGVTMKSSSLPSDGEKEKKEKPEGSGCTIKTKETHELIFDLRKQRESVLQEYYSISGSIDNHNRIHRSDGRGA